jgi:sigma54-dependent transcription regulator
MSKVTRTSMLALALGAIAAPVAQAESYGAHDAFGKGDVYRLRDASRLGDASRKNDASRLGDASRRTDASRLRDAMRHTGLPWESVRSAQTNSWNQLGY